MRKLLGSAAHHLDASAHVRTHIGCGDSTVEQVSIGMHQHVRNIIRIHPHPSASIRMCAHHPQPALYRLIQGYTGLLGTTIGEQGISPKESEQDCLDVHARALRAGARAHYARAQYTTRRSR